MNTFIQDLRYGVRMLLKRRAFTLIAVLTLALGIGANTAIFSVVNAVLLRPLPYRNPDRLVRVWETRPQQNFNRTFVSEGEYLAWREARSFENVALLDSLSFNLAGGGEPERVAAARVTADFFSMVGVAPLSGRVFSRDEEEPGHNEVALLSYGLWQRRFGKDPGVVGKTILLDSRRYTVIGVLPRGFMFDQPADVWVPFAFTAEEDMRWGHHYLGIFARLRPQVDPQQAQAELNTIAQQLQREHPPTNTGHGVELVPLYEDIVGDTRVGLLVLLGAVGFVLLIACANVANLLLARASGRQKEIAIRAALGASRGRLMRQVLTESTLLALLGGALGLLFSLWTVEALVALSRDILPRTGEVHLDGWVLGFTLLLSLGAGILFGMAPAFQVSSLTLSESLKEGGRTSSAGSGSQGMRPLVVTEIALALVVLIGAGLMTRSFLRIRQVDAGFDPHNLLTLEISLHGSRYSTSQQQDALFRQLIERLESLPGARSAGAVNVLPLSGNNVSGSFAIEGRAPAPPGQKPNTNRRIVTPHYFTALGMPLLRGREFTEADSADAPPVVIINETFARRFFPGEDPLGKRVRRGGADPWMTIVGMVKDVRHRGLDLDARPEMYIPYPQLPEATMTLVLRTEGEPGRLVSAVRKEVSALDQDLPVGGIRQVAEVVADSLATRRLAMLLFGSFALVALVLSAVGISGVMAYSVTRRRHEIGVRMALGARPGDVLRLVVGQGSKLLLTGVAIGLVAAVALTRVMTSLLFGVTTTDPTTFAGVTVLLAAVALLACYIPARRATKVDPMAALRYE